jgi:hypothetical protein
MLTPSLKDPNRKRASRRTRWLPTDSDRLPELYTLRSSTHIDDRASRLSTFCRRSSLPI